MRKPCQRNSTRDREKAERAALRDLALELEAHLKVLSRGSLLQPRRPGVHSAWKGFADRQARARRAAEEANRTLNQRVQSNADWIQRLWELLHEKRRAAEASSVKRTAALHRRAEDDLVLTQLKQQAEKAVLRAPGVFVEHGVQMLDNPLQASGSDQVPEVWTHQSNGDLQSTFLCVRRVPFDMQSTSTAVWTALSRPKGSFTSDASLGAASQEVELKTRIVERTPSFSTMKVRDRILLDNGASVIDYHAVVRRSALAEHANVFVWHSVFTLENGNVAYEDTLWIAVRRCPSGRMEAIVAIVGESQLKPKVGTDRAARLQASIMPAIEACVESMLLSADDLLLHESVHSTCSADEMAWPITV
jgi:hypothetical protein